MTHQEFIETSKKQYFKDVIEPLNIPVKETDKVYIVWSCKTANNSKVILADGYTKTLCEVTLIGSKNLLIYDYYTKTNHIEYHI